MKMIIQASTNRNGTLFTRFFEVFVTEHGVSIGREGTEVKLNDEFCSRRHALIYLSREGSFHIRDMSSENGTFLDGARVSEGYLPVGAPFRIGRTEIRLLHRGVLKNKNIIPSVAKKIDSSAAPVRHGWPGAWECMPKNDQKKLSPFPVRQTQAK